MEVVQTLRSKTGACRLRRSFRRRGCYHELEALFGGGKLRDIMFGMSSAYVLLHRSISLFLRPDSLLPQLHGAKAKELQEGYSRHSRAEALTPRQRLRQLEPSWLRRGQTTSLFASETEKDEVKEDRGGIVQCRPHHAQAGVERLDRS